MLEILDAVAAGVVTIDASDRVAAVNGAALTILGRSPGAVLGIDVITALGGDEELRAIFSSRADGGRVGARITRGDGERSELEFVVMRPSWENPVFDYALLFRRSLARPGLDDQLVRIERLQSLSRMVAGFAHEVRNPLAGIRALAEGLAAEMAPEDPRREYPARMIALSRRIEEFVRMSLEFAQPESPRFERSSAADIARRAATGWERGAGSVEVEVRAPAAMLMVDVGQIERGLRALIANAVEAGGDPVPRLVVKAERGPDQRSWVSFEVHDNGTGIPTELRSRVFDPFFTTKPKALGLGLPIAQVMAERNRGILELQSQPNVETVAVLRLPAAAP